MGKQTNIKYLLTFVYKNIKVNRLKKMSFRPFFKPDSDRVLDVSFFLKLSAFALDTVCLSLWLTAADEPDQLVPMNSGLELTLCYLTVPGYVVVLGGLVWLYLLGEPPHLITQRIFLSCGFSLFIVTGIFGVVDYFQENADVNMLVAGLLCVCVGVILLVDFLLNEHFFRVRSTEEDQPDGTTVAHESVASEP